MMASEKGLVHRGYRIVRVARPISNPLTDVDARIRFKRQPKALPANQRVSYRLAVLVLILARFKASTAAIENIHLLSWALRTQRSRALITAWWAGRRTADTATDRIDPGLAITLNLALMQDLIQIVGSERKKVQLTAAGTALSHTIAGNGDLLQIEKKFLDSLMPLSDTKIKKYLSKVLS